MAKKGINVFLGLDSTQFDKRLKASQRKLGEWSKTANRIGKSLSTNLTLPILAAGGAAVKLASDFEETQQKFDVVFSDVGQKANDMATQFADSFGVSNKEAKEMLSSTGDLLVGFGFAKDEAFNLAMQTNILASDLASFQNVEGGAAGASEALTKALVGQTEQAQSLGIVINQNTKEFRDRVKATMKAKDVDELQAKALVRLQIAAEQSGQSLGDIERTKGSLANQARFLAADITDLSVDFGTLLIPVTKILVEKLRGLVLFFTSLSQQTKETIIQVLGITAAVGPLVLLFGKLFEATSFLIGGFGKLGKVLLTNPFVAFVTGATAAWFAIQKLIGAQRDLTNATKQQIETGLAQDLQKAKDIMAEISEPSVWQKIKKAGLTALFGEVGAMGLQNKQLETLQANIENAQEALKAFGDTGKKSKSDTEDLKKELEEITKLLSQSGDNSVVGAYEETRKASRKYVLAIVADAERAAERLARFSDGINNLIKGAVTSMLELTGEALGNMLTGAGGWKDFGNSILKIIGQFLIDLGKSLILYSSLIESFKQAWKIPEAGIGLGIAAIAAGSAFMNLAEGGVPAMAEGGIVTGPTLALIGEGSESEVVLPLSKLSSMMQTGGTQKVIVEGMISGQDILLSNDRARKRRNRVR